MDSKKIGVFGWTGTGKTTYVSMLQYLFSSNIHPFVISSKIEDDFEIEENISHFIESDAWDSVTARIDGTLHTTALAFTIDTLDGVKTFEIQDYKGESISKQRDNGEQSVHDYFVGCDAILLFLDSEAFVDNNDSANRKRWNEFQDIVFKMVSDKKNRKIEIPMYLVITKKDVLAFDEDDNLIITAELKDRYEKMIEVLSHYSSSIRPYFVSTKECYEYYIVGKGNKKNLAEDFCAPVTRALKEIKVSDYNSRVERLSSLKEQREVEQKHKKDLFLKKWSLLGGGVVLLTVSLYTYFSVQYGSEIESLSSQSELVDLHRFKAEHSLFMYPHIKEKLNHALNATSREIVDSILSPKINESERLEQVNKFSELFRSSQFKQDFSEKTLKQLTDIEQSAKIVNQILDSEVKEFNRIVVYCSEYEKRVNKYFYDMVSTKCKIAESDKSVFDLQEAQKERERRLQARIAEEQRRAAAAERARYEEASKSWWDKLWD